MRLWNLGSKYLWKLILNQLFTVMRILCREFIYTRCGPCSLLTEPFLPKVSKFLLMRKTHSQWPRKFTFQYSQAILELAMDMKRKGYRGYWNSHKQKGANLRKRNPIFSKCTSVTSEDTKNLLPQSWKQTINLGKSGWSVPCHWCLTFNLNYQCWFPKLCKSLSSWTWNCMQGLSAAHGMKICWVMWFWSVDKCNYANTNK